MNFEDALVLARHILEVGKCTPEEAASNPAIPERYQSGISKRLLEETTTELIPVTPISNESHDPDWLDKRDRQGWYYWPRLRAYLLECKRWPIDRVRSLDDSSDKTLERLCPPENEGFDTRGLVLGYVQSGKTANYTSLIAKAADVGYKLFIVLAGMDNGLRRQTQLRLEQELVGDPGNRGNSVEYPRPGKQWHVFTSKDIEGDFKARNVNTAALQGTQPVLLVVKKNSHVLRGVLKWVSETETQTLRQLSVLVIDDEADQASIDTRGTRAVEGEESPEDSRNPSVINGRIRELLSKFTRSSFVAYTATPFANILIPADQQAQDLGRDLYPKDFIIDLPKPRGYVGAEELFGQTGLGDGAGENRGLDVFRMIPEEEAELRGANQEAPLSLRSAILHFVLAGAERTRRSEQQSTPERKPSMMLVHTSWRVADHNVTEQIVDMCLQHIKDMWRYDKSGGIQDEMEKHWVDDFCTVTGGYDPTKSVNFSKLGEYIGPFLESVHLKTVNSEAGDFLDYEEEPYANTIVIGGNKLSRGMTLEGLLVSYFTREARVSLYDTVMQMGRWFGFREDYVDLTRLYTTGRLADKFVHLSIVERRLREDMAIYSRKKGVTPTSYGMRVLGHPSMRVTNPLKQRFAREFTASYSGVLFQTFRFPLDHPELLVRSADKTLEATEKFLSSIDSPQREGGKFVWINVAASAVVDYLARIENPEHDDEFLDVKRYIEERVEEGELASWTIVISQLQRENKKLGHVDWGINENVNQISRTRLVKTTNSLGVIVEPKDLEIGLSREQIALAHEKFAEGLENDSQERLTRSKALRIARPAEEGLLVLYPISKYSVAISGNSITRNPLYDDPDNEFARNLIGIAISFPESKHADYISYVHGSPGWNPAYD